MASKNKKSPLSPKLIGIIVVVLLLAGVGAYFVIGKNGKSSGSNAITSIKDALSASVSMECEFTDPEGRKSKAFIKNGAMRLDYTGKTAEEGSGGMISRDNKVYMWNGKEGTVMEVAEGSKSTEGSEEASIPESKEDFIKEMEQYKDQCKTAIVSDAVFTPPADVEFKDFSELMKANTEPAGGASEQDYQKMIQQYQQQAEEETPAEE